ncbi:MAG: cysteine desulfurase [Chloroflexi bacterium]|nr:cysteine desulfurase [Chloroflexota bacterium]MCH8196301.1 cysteine desulfurase [Chloroflexota bacterium]
MSDVATSDPIKPVFVDYQATTPCLPEVVEAMLPFFTERFHNPQSDHPSGEEAMDAVEEARREVAALIGAASPREIIFTSGATESNNWALRGIAGSPRRRGRHFVTSQIEHFSVTQPMKSLEQQGFEVTYVPVDADGVVDPASVAGALRDDTALVSMIHASNEIGVIEPLAEVGRICRDAGAPFHVDASNTVGTIPFDVRTINADLVTVSPHLFYGPKGVGALYCRRGVRVAPLLEGGVQEDGRRAGTENVPAIVGFGRACAIAAREMEARMGRLVPLRDALLDGVRDLEGVRVTGHLTQRLPNHVSCVVDHVESESLLLALAMGPAIFAASGTACSGREKKQSPVLEAIGIGAGLDSGSLVFGLGIDTTAEDVARILRELPKAIAQLRALSPLA